MQQIYFHTHKNDYEVSLQGQQAKQNATVMVSHTQLHSLHVLLIFQLDLDTVKHMYLLAMLEGSLGPSSSNLITVSKSREISSLEVQWTISLSLGFIKQTVNGYNINQCMVPHRGWIQARSQLCNVARIPYTTLKHWEGLGTRLQLINTLAA